MQNVFLMIAYYLSQMTLGLLQNLAGLVILIRYHKKEHFIYKGAVVTVWNESGPSLSMGMFIFMSRNCAKDLDHPEDRETTFKKTLVHEYGHSLQSALLGPFYLPIIGISSSVWCSSKKLSAKREKQHISYYSFFPERWANHLGEKATGEKSMGQSYIG